MAKKSIDVEMSSVSAVPYGLQVLVTYVKSPVASLCFACSSVRNLVSVTISVLTFSWLAAISNW